MFTAPLHAGTEHPDLLWIVLASLLTLAAGLGIGMFSDRVRSLLGIGDDEEQPVER